MNKKLIVKLVVVALILASIAGNIYSISNNWWTGQKNKWVNTGVRLVFETAVKSGQVVLSTDDGDITLILLQDQNGEE